MILHEDELEEFNRSLNRVIEIITKFGKRISPRDMFFLKIGLRASHIEEAITQGDTVRAKAHLKNLVNMMRTARW